MARKGGKSDRVFSLDKARFADLIKNLRSQPQRKLTQQEIAKGMGISLHTVNSWENAKCSPKEKECVERLANFLGATTKNRRALLVSAGVLSLGEWFDDFIGDHQISKGERTAVIMHLASLIKLLESRKEENRRNK